MKQFFATILLVFTAANVLADNSVTITNIEYMKELPGGSSRIYVDFPTGNDNVFRRAIIDYINESLHSDKGIDAEFPSNTCDENTFKAFLEEYTANTCLLVAKDQHEYAAYCLENGEDYTVRWFSNSSVQKEADTDLYVSYAAYHGEFIGGAHDERSSGAITIRKSDGARITDIFKENVEDDMQPLLWKYLIASQQPYDEKEYVAEIKNFLEANYGNRDFLLLPHGTSYLAPDGVHILYQQLEICFWAMGAPEITIPYEAAKPFLTDEAAQLIQGK